MQETPEKQQPAFKEEDGIDLLALFGVLWDRKILILLVTGGVLVGFGTRLSSGCTSGHGISGISRFSLRSIIATITFMIVGILTDLITGSL